MAVPAKYREYTAAAPKSLAGRPVTGSSLGVVRKRSGSVWRSAGPRATRMDSQRDKELLMLGAILASSAFAKAAFEAVNAADFQDREISSVFEELKSGGVGKRVTTWMQRRGVAVNGRVVESLLAQVVKDARGSRMKALTNRLQLAIAAGCQEEVDACLDGLARERKSN